MNLVARPLWAKRETLLAGSFKSPKTIASAGHDCTHAGCTSPSRSGLASCFASSSTRLIRWEQKVHFSITPTGRTETSGLSCRVKDSGHAGSNQLKNRTLYGQLLAQ